MKSAPPLLASCLWCKTAAESSRENNGRAGALIHPSACRLWDLGLTPITYREGGGGEGGGGIWAGAKEMSMFSLWITSLGSFLSVKPMLPPPSLPAIIIQQFILFLLYLCCSLSLSLFVSIIANSLSSHPALSSCWLSSPSTSLCTVHLPVSSSLSFLAISLYFQSYCELVYLL